MELEQISALLDRFDASSCSVLELELGDCRLRLEKPCVGAQVAVPAAVAAPRETVEKAERSPEEGKALKAPLVGTFYAAPAPDQPPFVTVGSRVSKGQTVCVLEAMKMMSEVPAPADCIIEEILVENGELVGFDQPLMRYREV